MPNSEYQRGLEAAKQGELVSEELTHSPLPWDFTWFTKPDGSEIKTPQDVADTCAFSALQCEGTTLWGVTLAEKDKEGRTLVICYTGNGPHSEANARLITVAVNALNITQPAAAIRALISTQPLSTTGAQNNDHPTTTCDVMPGGSSETAISGSRPPARTELDHREDSTEGPQPRSLHGLGWEIGDDPPTTGTFFGIKRAEPATPPTPQPERFKVGGTLTTDNWPVQMWETIVFDSGEPVAVAVRRTEHESRQIANFLVDALSALSGRAGVPVEPQPTATETKGTSIADQVDWHNREAMLTGDREVAQWHRSQALKLAGVEPQPTPNTWIAGMMDAARIVRDRKGKYTLEQTANYIESLCLKVSCAAECTREAPHICRVNGPCNGLPKSELAGVGQRTPACTGCGKRAIRTLVYDCECGHVEQRTPPQEKKR